MTAQCITNESTNNSVPDGENWLYVDNYLRCIEISLTNNRRNLIKFKEELNAIFLRTVDLSQ